MTSMDSCSESSLEDIAARIAQVEHSAGGEIPLAESGDIAWLQFETQHHVADAAAELMTGLHLRSEQREYMRRYSIYRQLLGKVAMDLAERTYTSGGDTGNVKREVFGYLQQSKRQMVALDYQKRLEKSRLERSKQWLAHHRKTRFVGTFAVSGMTTSALFMAGDEFAPMLDLSKTQTTGAAGVATLAGMMMIRSVLRSGPTKAGAVLSRQFNATLETYEIDKKKQKRKVKETLQDMPDKYAEKHLTIPFGAAAIYLTNYDLSNPENGSESDQLRTMIDGALDITEQSMFDSYGINPAKLA